MLSTPVQPALATTPIVSSGGPAKVVARINTDARWKETLTISQTVGGGFSAQLGRDVNGKTLTFDFTNGEKSTRKPSEGLTEGERHTMLYNLDLFRRWFGVEIAIDQVGEYASYKLKGKAATLQVTVITDTAGKVLFSGFNFKEMPGASYFRRGV